MRRYERAVGEVFGEGKNRRRGCGFGFGFGEGKFDLLWRELLGKILAREKIAQLLLSRIEATRLPGVRGEPATRLRRGWFDVSALVSGLPLRAPNKRGRREYLTNVDSANLE